MPTEELEKLKTMRIIDMTGEQFVALVTAANAANPAPPAEEVPKYVYGLGGLASLLGCSDTTAWRIKKSGIIDSAIHQYGKTMMFETQKVLDIMKKTR